MTEPPRLHTEPESELERSLLDAGRSYTASSSSRAKALAALGIVGVTASSTTAASALTKAGVAKWIAATVLIASVAVPVVHYLEQRNSTPTPAPVSVRVSSPGALTAAPPLLIAPPTLSSNPTSGNPTPRDATNAPADPSPSSPGRAELKPVSPTPLAAELSALDSARSALAGGNPSAALSGLDAYARNFPRGRLSLEAEVLRIDALAKSGQSAAAKKHAEAFIKLHPGSVLASRVRAYAGQ